MTAKVYEKDGQLVLEDPDAAAVLRAIAKRNCDATVEQLRDRVRHFVQRFAELGLTAAGACIVIANVDTHAGELVADATMPGHDWQAYRDRGEIPYARGLATTPGIYGVVDLVDEEEAAKLDELVKRERLALVVFDHDVCVVYNARVEAQR